VFHGCRATIRYHAGGGKDLPTYLCQRDGIDNARPICTAIPGRTLDEHAGQLLISTLTPLAVEAALQVSAELRQRAAEADALRAAHVERARYHADLARRRYLAFDPSNRLVAGTLEADWNTALRALGDAQAAYDKAREQHDGTLTAHVRLAGGQHRTLTLPVPEPAWKIRQIKAATIAEIDKLLDHHTCAEIAGILRSRGLPNGEGHHFTPTMVERVIRTYQLRSRRQQLLDAGLIPLAQMAALLGVSTGTVKIWHHAGIVSGQRYNDKGEVLYDPPGPNPPAPHQGRRHDTVRPA
jgi:hypothetical protein